MSVRRRLGLWAGALGLAVLALPAVALGATAPPAITPLPASWTARFAVLPHKAFDLQVLRRQAQSGGTIPFWTSTITSPLDGKTYTTSMVGSSPYDPVPLNTNITFVPIVIRLHFPGGIVLDPTLPGLCETQGQSMATRFFNSPLFVPGPLSSNGVDVTNGLGGGVQLINGFQRANYWSAVGGSAYGVTLVPSQASPIVVDVTAPPGSLAKSTGTTCGPPRHHAVNIGYMDINAFDVIVENLASTYSGPSQFPVFLINDVLMFNKVVAGCCILGYHNAVPVAGGTQTYGVASTYDPLAWKNIPDIYIWSHELAEWMDDPFAQAPVAGGGKDDITPRWGHVGQVSSCQADLEVGDPLSFTTHFTISGVGGYVYSYQDLAFHDWFYRTPSTSTGQKYSFQGTFSTTPAACH